MCVFDSLLPSSPPRFHNKGVYLQLGLQKMISKSESSELQRHIKLYVRTYIENEIAQEWGNEIVQEWGNEIFREWENEIEVMCNKFP